MLNEKDTGTRMLYKYPGIHNIHGSKYDYIIVPEKFAERYVNEEEWSYTTDEAFKLFQKKEKENAKFKSRRPPNMSEVLWDDLGKSTMARHKLVEMYEVKNIDVINARKEYQKKVKHGLVKKTDSDSGT